MTAERGRRGTTRDESWRQKAEHEPRRSARAPRPDENQIHTVCAYGFLSPRPLCARAARAFKQSGDARARNPNALERPRAMEKEANSRYGVIKIMFGRYKSLIDPTAKARSLISRGLASAAATSTPAASSATPSTAVAASPTDRSILHLFLDDV